MSADADIKRVGSSGQISVGKELAGRYFREDRRPDGSIVLTPVAVVPHSHWTLRDQKKITRALEWAARTPPCESSVETLTPTPRKRTRGSPRGRRR